MTTSIRVLVASGSSGGHLFPAQALIDSLKEEPGIETLLALPKKSILKRGGEAAPSGIEYLSVSSIGLKPSFRNISAFFNFFKSFFEAAAILRRFRPDIAVGFGSIASVPVVLLSRMRGIKTLIHEQNVFPGRATRFLCGFTDIAAISFAESGRYLKRRRVRVVLTGNPLRKALTPVGREEALGFFGLRPDRSTIMVCGGSQSSSRLNNIFPQALTSLAFKDKVQVIHLSGEKELKQVEEKYKEMGVVARCFAFLDKMQYAYSCSDLAVSRSGATTVSELIFFRVPAILLPYPYAYGHQSLNAEVLAQSGSAVIIEERSLDGQRLGEELKRLLSGKDALSAMRASYASMPEGDHGESLKKAVLSLLEKRSLCSG